MVIMMNAERVPGEARKAATYHKHNIEKKPPSFLSQLTLILILIALFCPMTSLQPFNFSLLTRR